MSKLGLVLTSLVGAIPGGVMAAVMVMAFVNYAGGSSTTFKVLAGLLLLIGSFLAAMPVGILLFAGPKSEKKIKKAKDVEKAKAEGSGDKAPESAEVEEVEVVAEDDATMEVSDDSPDSEVFAETIDQPIVDAGSDEFDLGDDDSKKS